MELLAVVWSFWIGVSLVLGTIIAVLVTGFMYYKKVVAPRYPRD